MQGVEISLAVVAMLVLLALAFDFMNGFHDAANSIATVVSTGVLKPHQAVVWAAFFNVVAAVRVPAQGGDHDRQGHHRSGHRRPLRGVRCARRRHRLEHHHLVLRHPVQFLPCADRRSGGRRSGQGRAGLPGPGRSRQDRALHLRLAAARHAARIAADAGGVVAVLPHDADARGQVVPPPATAFRPRSTASATAATTRRRPWASSGCC